MIFTGTVFGVDILGSNFSQWIFSVFFFLFAFDVFPRFST